MGIDHSENWGCQGLLVVNHSTVQATIPHSGPLIRYPHQLQLQFVNVIMFLLFIYLFFNSNSPKWLPFNWQAYTGHASFNSGGSVQSALNSFQWNLPEVGWPGPMRCNCNNKCQSFWNTCRSEMPDWQDRRQQRAEESNLITVLLKPKVMWLPYQASQWNNKYYFTQIQRNKGSKEMFLQAEWAFPRTCWFYDLICALSCQQNSAESSPFKAGHSKQRFTVYPKLV